MRDAIFTRHLSRLKSALSAHSPKTICDFITKNTYLAGRPFSFAGHGYQETILNDDAQTIIIGKSAQLGISEMSSRLALARCALINGFSVIYTLPAATAAQSFMQTRINPVVDSSPYLKEIVNKQVDNSSVKQFGDSYLYLKGCQVDRQAISVPADMLITDEVNNSDQEVMTLYESRLIHSEYQLRMFLSTPSVPNYGIHAMLQQSKRKYNMAKCPHCNTWFLPDYHVHVRVPGFYDNLDSITKQHFADPKFRWMEAYVECPSCHMPVDMIEAKRDWVVENPDEAFIDSGYQISPFDCPERVKVSALVKSSVTYERLVDFYNQRLGKSLEDKQTALSLAELEAAIVHDVPGGTHSFVMGVDTGSTCWITVSAVLCDQTMVLVKNEAVPLHKVVERAVEIQLQYRIRMIVIDRGPMTEVVYRIQEKIRNSFAAVFVMSKDIDLFRVREKEADSEKGVEDMRQVNINKDACMDVIMDMVRSGKILKLRDEMDKTWCTHMTDNKRVQIFKNGELIYTWVKTLKIDHLHMTLLYAFVASRMLGVSAGSMVALPLVSSIHMATRKPVTRPESVQSMGSGILDLNGVPFR